MSPSITWRGVAVLAAATFTLFAALATASQAGAATYYACVKRNGSAHVYTKKRRCRRGEKLLSWNNMRPAGRNGRNGTNGETGTNGRNGTNGADGETGAPGGFFGVLPSGEMMTGTFASQGDRVGHQYRTAVSFMLSLPVAPTGEQIHYIKVGEPVPPGCGGTVESPVALPGNLCIFEGVSVGNEANRGEVNPINDEAPNISMPVFGFGVYASCEAIACFNEGAWAVTAP
jgi:hypothetical protein